MRNIFTAWSTLKSVCWGSRVAMFVHRCNNAKLVCSQQRRPRRRCVSAQHSPDGAESSNRSDGAVTLHDEHVPKDPENDLSAVGHPGTSTSSSNSTADASLEPVSPASTASSHTSKAESAPPSLHDTGPREKKPRKSSRRSPFSFIWRNKYPQLIVSVTILLAFDQSMRRLFTTCGISFPPTLAGMIGVTAALSAIASTSSKSRKLCDKVVAYFQPALFWIARWMPIFFVPSLIVLPHASAGLPAGSLPKLLGVIVVGWVSTLLVAVGSAASIRGMVHTELTKQEVAKTSPKPLNPFTAWHYFSWAAIAGVALTLAHFMPEQRAMLGSVFTLASTVKGYLLGAAMPAAVKAVLHPLVTCTLVGNGACAVWAYVAGISYQESLMHFLQTGPGAMGAGNVLMKLLGVVVLADGFRIYLQRKVLRRHFVEIFGTVLVCSTFSLFFTAAACRVVALDPVLAASALARSITVALALPVSAAVGGSASLTAAIVCTTGLLGAAFGQIMLRVLGVRDEISRGLSQAASSHGLGSAAMASTEPQALPFCAVTVAIMGTVSNVLVLVPPVRSALLAIIGV